MDAEDTAEQIATLLNARWHTPCLTETDGRRVLLRVPTNRGVRWPRLERTINEVVELHGGVRPTARNSIRGYIELYWVLSRQLGVPREPDTPSTA